MWTYRGLSACLALVSVVTFGTRIGSLESFGTKNVISRAESWKTCNKDRRSFKYPIGFRRRCVSNRQSLTGKTHLFSSQDDCNDIRFLGKGPNAIVRPGAVLLAPAEEFHHFLRQSAVFIYDMGVDDNDDYVIRGVILDNPTPFSIGEMMEKKESGGVYENLIFRGGESGGQEAFCLHSVDTLGLEEIGTSGIYQGGDLDKIEDSAKVKFFFNYMEFFEQELEEMLEVIHDGDGWTSVEVPSNMVLNSDYDKGEAWSKLRNMIRYK